jgi:hypothetical protein
MTGMRSAPILITVLAAGIVMAMAVPTAQAQQCEVRCSNHCWTTPRGRCCARRCVRHCSAPRYVEPRQPAYRPTYTYTPTYQHIGLQFPPEVAVLVGLGVVGLIALIAGAAAFSRSNIETEIAKVEKSTALVRGLAREAEHTTQEIDSYIEGAASEARAAGRAAADREWEAWGRE